MPLEALKGGFKMGHKDYSKFSEKKEENEEVVETTVTGEASIEVSTEEAIQIVTEQVNHILEEPATIPVTELSGFVDGCDQLYVRKEGNKDSEPITIIKRSDEVVIDLENSTEYFYKVKTSEGVEGYCMKQFITIR